MPNQKTPNPRAATCVFCDDIRAEVGNKISLMGIYASDILLSSPPPVMLPKFALVAWVLSDFDDRPTRVTVRILVPPGRTELARLEADTDEVLFPHAPDELSKASLRIMTTMMPLTLTEEGFLEVMIDTERETFRAGRLRIRFNVPSAEIMGEPNA
jgi:hypothetical protein